MNFTPDENKLLLYAVGDLVARAGLGIRPPLPNGFETLHVKLISSVRGTKTCVPQPQWPPSTEEELIDTAEAASILSCSTRWVRRIRDQLDGRDIGGRWLFPRRTVVMYVERKASQCK
ncbi:helix-turn-helix domain-containing protein [Mycolicibacter hiberniae]|uniref:Helix-turn-helix domain-containing protein n=1 Tax=Mycolicibacter hiberniae TaxID=29314 RepID=A0A7I7X9X1_9MYCO|nr:helix-turn-helix domain-containing protein [Mycolicibacter hiberniae]MCV7087364.1 helix-turn-helix domain-containing protein [Mycolicibacter hiberniae]ORV67672.1 hypothetical protein AWC09_15920 [Mycolicibacter hiberniae]BBZ25421.1 hypothetical protein MHIB_38390 [Mycolicibacter hiberniae]